MSIGSIGSDSNWWTQQSLAAQTSTTTTSSNSSSTSSGDPVANTGSVAATSNFASMLQAFSADLQAMLTQMGNTASNSTTAAAASAATTAGTTTVTSTTTASAAATTTSDTASSTQSQDGVHHHHHHHSEGDQGGSMQTAADQLVGEMGQSLQSGSQTANGISNSASSFATDVMQAMRAYGANTPAASTTATLV